MRNKDKENVPQGLATKENVPKLLVNKENVPGPLVNKENAPKPLVEPKKTYNKNFPGVSGSGMRLLKSTMTSSLVFNKKLEDKRKNQKKEVRTSFINKVHFKLILNLNFKFV